MNRGLYLISDGGYFKCRFLQAPDPYSIDAEELEFSDHIESTRKDIEHIFGMLKNRFRILKNDVLFHNMDDIVTCFKACCCLHNMILDFDGNTLAAAIVAHYDATADGRDFEVHRQGRSADQGKVDQSSAASDDLRKKLVENFSARRRLGNIINREVIRRNV